jgi:hypothetical protein
MFHSPFSRSALRGSLSSRLIAQALIFGLVAAGIPGLPSNAGGEPTLGDPVYLSDGHSVLSLDAEALREVWRVIVARSGSRSLTLYAAPPTERHDAGFAAIDSWDPVITWTVSATAGGLTSTLGSGFDRVATTVPWNVNGGEGLLSDSGSQIEVEVNGVVVHLDAESLYDLQRAVLAGEVLSPESLPPGLERIAAAFHDLAGFVDHAQRLYLVESRVRGDADWDGSLHPVPHGCASVCMGCAASMLVSVGAYLGLVAGCGGALVTGGATALACVAAFIGVQASHLAVFSSCGRCFDCADTVD